ARQAARFCDRWMSRLPTWRASCRQDGRACRPGSPGAAGVGYARRRAWVGVAGMTLCSPPGRLTMWSEGNTPASADKGAPSRPRISEEALRTAHIERGADREVRTPGVRPDRDGLRAAYLGLLKLALCDLAGARTQSVRRVGDGRSPSSQVFSRELTEDEIALRVRGADWPFSGLSMIGLPRLDDLQSCVE